MKRANLDEARKAIAPFVQVAACYNFGAFYDLKQEWRSARTRWETAQVNLLQVNLLP
jgi:hypothetical protein